MESKKENKIKIELTTTNFSINNSTPAVISKLQLIENFERNRESDGMNIIGTGG